jgi:4-amino-4-deoxy-L-arabinose transferase-like glycosyltransferase
VNAPWTPSDRRRLLVVVAAAFALYCYGLGVGSLWDQDEALYTQVAVDIVSTGDPITLHRDGAPWFVHPPLYMWLQAAIGKVFGFTEFTARVWSAVSGAAVVAATFALAKMFYGPRTAPLAAGITATTFQVLVQSKIAVFDPTLLAFMLFGLYMYLVGYTTRSRRAYIWAWVWCGLATLTKGPIGLMLPAMVVVALWAIRGEWGRWREVPVAGPILYALVGLPWYIVETVRHGEAFIRTAVGYYMFNRFFGVVEDQPGPWFYYVPVLLLGAYPWTTFLPSAAAWLSRRRDELASQVILLWCGITLVFYSLAGTKLPNYILPIYPVIAIGIARLWVAFLDEASEEARRLMRWSAGLLPLVSALFVAALIIYGYIKFPAEAAALRTPLVVIVSIFAGGPLIARILYLTGRPRATLAALMLISVVAVVILVHASIPAVEAYRPVPRIGRLLHQTLEPDVALAAVEMRKTPSIRYYARRAVIWVDDAEGLAEARCRHERLVVVVRDAEYRGWVAEALGSSVARQGQTDGYRILVLRERAAPCPNVPNRPGQPSGTGR